MHIFRMDSIYADFPHGFDLCNYFAWLTDMQKCCII